MAFPSFISSLVLAQTLLSLSITTTSTPTPSPSPTPTPAPASSKPRVANSSILFREYIVGNSVRFSNVPINPDVEFHFIISFAIDYTISSNSPSPANGKFNVFWNTGNLSPMNVLRIKVSHENVKFALSLGGYIVGNNFAFFQPKVFFAPDSIDSWLNNAISSLTRIIKKYRLDGIDIHYDNFYTDSNTFAECIGQLIINLKTSGVISFASIAPFDDSNVQSHYQTLWRKYRSVIDYVNFQFYGYDKYTNVSQFLQYFDQQRFNYGGGQILASFISDQSRGLSPDNGFFKACDELKNQGKLGGIFVWCADLSWENGFRYEKQAQMYLTSE